MATDTITGQDTLTLYDRVFLDLADGDASTITYPNDMVAVSTGKNGNTIFTKILQNHSLQIDKVLL